MCRIQPMISAQTAPIMESVCKNSSRKSTFNDFSDVTMVQRGPTYVMLAREGLGRLIGGELIIMALGCFL